VTDQTFSAPLGESPAHSARRLNRVCAADHWRPDVFASQNRSI